MRAFQTRWFRRWAMKEGIADAALVAAAKEIIEGVFEASLGRSLIKKRIARPGEGKSGGYRVIVGYKMPNDDRVIFLYGFPKNAQSNISDAEKEALGKTAKAYMDAPSDVIGAMLSNKTLFEMPGG